MVDEPRELLPDEIDSIAGGVTTTSNVSVTEKVTGSGSASVTFANGVFTVHQSGDAIVTTSYRHTP